MTKRYSVTDSKLTLSLEEAPEGGFAVTSPMDPALITEAETIQEAFLITRDALATLEASRSKLQRRLRRFGKELAAH